MYPGAESHYRHPPAFVFEQDRLVPSEGGSRNTQSFQKARLINFQIISFSEYTLKTIFVRYYYEDEDPFLTLSKLRLWEWEERLRTLFSFGLCPGWRYGMLGVAIIRRDKKVYIQFPEESSPSSGLPSSSPVTFSHLIILLLVVTPTILLQAPRHVWPPPRPDNITWSSRQYCQNKDTLPTTLDLPHLVNVPGQEMERTYTEKI